MVLVIPAALLGWQANLNYLGTWYHRVATMAHRIDPTGQVSIPYVGSNQSLNNGVYRLGNWAAYQFSGGPDDRVVTELSLIPETGMPMDAAAVGVSLLAMKVLELPLFLKTAVCPFLSI